MIKPATPSRLVSDKATRNRKVPFSDLVSTRRQRFSKPLLASMAAIAGLAYGGVVHASTSIPLDSLGSEATKRYGANVAEITAASDGVVLRAVMQDLEATATAEGLWLTSRAEEDSAKPNRFMLRAVEFGRESMERLPAKGEVRNNGDVVEWIRSGVVEEYRVDGDGVRQDFLVAGKPEGRGDLAVALELLGATAREAAHGATLTVQATGREIAYHRLRVSDAKGRELPARMEVAAADRLVLRVNDDGAEYPVRIDPTFSDADWISINPGIPGANKSISAFAVDGGNNLYIAGEFTFIGNVEANYIAKWSGSQWSPLGSGMNKDAKIYALATDAANNLYAGGEFNRAGGVLVRNIAFWNGSAWAAVGTGVNNTVYALAVDISRNHIYAGGTFDIAGVTIAGADQAAIRIARWDANSQIWEPLRDNNNSVQGTNGTVRALAVDSANRIVYAGGDFEFAGGDNVSRIAAWINGNDWVPLRDAVTTFVGVNNSVRALALDSKGLLYVGGLFTLNGITNLFYVASWNNATSRWAALNFGLNAPVHALAVDRADKVYAGGEFTKIRGAAPAQDRDANRVAKWDPPIANWSPLGDGVDNTVRALATNSQNLVYVGGDFSKVDNAAYADRIADWNGSTWGVLGSGLNNQVSALLVDSSGGLYAAGKFKAAGTEVVNGVAKWNGSQWGKLGSGVNADINALALDATSGFLYAGGSFTRAGNVDAFKIARFRMSGSSDWLPVGTGFFGGDVFALAFTAQGNLLAGGSFTHTANAAGAMGTTALSGLAVFEQNAWASVGNGPGQTVYALAVDGQTIYAGGSFANYIRQWNGTAWSVVGGGVNNTVRALALDASANLYAGGQFNTAGGIAAPHVARWNKAAWSSLGSGLNNQALSLTVDGQGFVYAGGSFTSAGGISANRTAVWNPADSSWGALGAGVNGDVLALSASGQSTLYAGGNFYTTGGKVSPFVSSVDVRPTPVISFTKPDDQAFSLFKKFSLTGSASSNETVIFSSSNTNVLSIQGNEATIQGSGSVTVTASTAANARWRAANPVQQTIQITPQLTNETFRALGGWQSYLAANLDVFNAGFHDESSAFAHWRDWGFSEGRRFDSGALRSDLTGGASDQNYAIDGGFAWKYADSNGRVGNTVVFITKDAPKPAGWDGRALLLRKGETFNLGASFLASAYRALNPDVRTAIDSGAIPNFASVTDHYVKYGFKEGRMANGNWTQAQKDAWNDDRYLNVHNDVRNFFLGARSEGWKLLGKYGFAHYINFGVAEGRASGQ